LFLSASSTASDRWFDWRLEGWNQTTCLAWSLVRWKIGESINKTARRSRYLFFKDVTWSRLVADILGHCICHHQGLSSRRSSVVLGLLVPWKCGPIGCPNMLVAIYHLNATWWPRRVNHHRHHHYYYYYFYSNIFQSVGILPSHCVSLNS